MKYTSETKSQAVDMNNLLDQTEELGMLVPSIELDHAPIIIPPPYYVPDGMYVSQVVQVAYRGILKVMYHLVAGDSFYYVVNGYSPTSEAYADFMEAMENAGCVCCQDAEELLGIAEMVEIAHVNDCPVIVKRTPLPADMLELFFEGHEDLEE